MTGPIAIEGALPGDELVVDVLAMELAQDWGWNRFAAGMGTLPIPEGKTTLIFIWIFVLIVAPVGKVRQ
jgi:acetamidase/formamidase